VVVMKSIIFWDVILFKYRIVCSPAKYVAWDFTEWATNANGQNMVTCGLCNMF
jgi:hypothetical protein